MKFLFLLGLIVFAFGDEPECTTENQGEKCNGVTRGKKCVEGKCGCSSDSDCYDNQKCDSTTKECKCPSEEPYIAIIKTSTYKGDIYEIFCSKCQGVEYQKEGTVESGLECKCKEGIGAPEKPIDFTCSDENTPQCGILTNEKGITRSGNGCNCIENAEPDGTDGVKCKCKTEFTADNTDNMCKKSGETYCGVFTKEKGKPKPTAGCGCVDNAEPDGTDGLKCKCKTDFEGDEAKTLCLPPKKCGDFTEAKKNELNFIPSEGCNCVDHSTNDGKYKCKCKDGYEGNTQKTECKEIQKCGDLTKEKGQPKPASNCTCVDNANKDGDLKCRCKDGFTGNGDNTKCEKVGSGAIQNAIMIALFFIALLF